MYVWCGTSVTRWDKRHTVGQASFRFVPGTKRDKRHNMGQASHGGTSVTTWDKPRRLSAVRPSRQSIRQAVATVCRVPLPACQRFDRAAGFRQRFAPSAFDLSQAAPWLRRATVRAAPWLRASRPPPSNAAPWLRPGCAALVAPPDSGEHRNAATIGSGQPFDRAAGFATIAGNAPKTPLQAVRRPSRVRARLKCAVRFASRFRPLATRARIRPPVPRHHRQAVRRSRPGCAARPPPSPETRRKRPPLRPPAPDGFAPVPPCRALASPFQAV